MDVDREARVFRLEPDEIEVLRFNPTADLIPFDEVVALHLRIRQEIDVVSEWDAYKEATPAERNQVLEERARRIRILGVMEGQLMPIAEEAVAQEAEQILRDDDSGA